MMNRMATLAGSLLLAAIALPACAQVVETYDYVPDRIYPVRTGLGITTQIELSPDEDVVDFSTGFSSGWDLTRRDNVFYLKPKNVDVDTNLLVRTQTHAYIFELKVVATDWTSLDDARRDGVQYKIDFAYPNGTRFSRDADAGDAAATATATAAAPLDVRLRPDRQYDTDYDFAARAGSQWLVPAAVYDDGRFTYIRMRTSADLPTATFPAVFARQREDDQDMVVNTTVEDDVVVVHGTYPFLVLRQGRTTVGLRRRTSP
jgi:type IV secretion system protein VirB9